MHIKYHSPTTGVTLDVHVDTFEQLSQVLDTLINEGFKPSSSTKRSAAEKPNPPQAKSAAAPKKAKVTSTPKSSKADIRQLFESIKVPEKFI